MILIFLINKPLLIEKKQPITPIIKEKIIYIKENKINPINFNIPTILSFEKLDNNMILYFINIEWSLLKIQDIINNTKHKFHNKIKQIIYKQSFSEKNLVYSIMYGINILNTIVKMSTQEISDSVYIQYSKLIEDALYKYTQNMIKCIMDLYQDIQYEQKYNKEIWKIQKQIDDVYKIFLTTKEYNIDPIKKLDNINKVLDKDKQYHKCKLIYNILNN